MNQSKILLGTKDAQSAFRFSKESFAMSADRRLNGMNDSALSWMMNDPYCVVAMAVVVIGGCIALAVDCWRNWH